MTLELPGQPLDDIELQYKLDTLAMAFPVQPQNLAEGVLKLAVTGTARKIAFGTFNVTYGGAVNFVDSASIPHGLGTTPVIAKGVSETAFMDAATLTKDGTNVVFRTFTTNAVNAPAATYTFEWIAIG